VVTGVDAMLRRRRRVRNRWLVSAGLVAAACAALVVALSKSSEAETPTEAVQQYVDALASEDFSRAWDLTCESEQRKSGSKDRFIAVQTEPRLVPLGPRIATEAVPFEPFPIEAWRVGHYRKEDLGFNAQVLVIRENDHLRVCGDPRYLYESRAGIA
jgi:hypothetical protein